MDTYGIGGYGAMIADRTRIDAYREALRRVVTPESVVLDLGTGTGVFAFLACELGARHVYAVESTSAIDLAREIASRNGLADRITFIYGPSTKVSMPEHADVMVSDMRGVLPLFERHVPAIVDARTHLLSPRGTLIPLRDEIWVSPVDVPDLYHEITGPWEDAPGGVQMDAARQMATQSWRQARIGTEHLLAAPQLWARLDYARIEEPNVEATLQWTVQRAGTAHGFAAWFSTELAEGVGFSNAPGGAELIYGQAFFPWIDEVPVFGGDTIEISLSANLVQQDYVWNWNSRVIRPGGPAGGGQGGVRAQFLQSTFHGQCLSLGKLNQREAGFVPVLGVAGEIARFILAKMDGATDLATIAEALLDAFPEEFPDQQAALDSVGRMSLEYGE